jgi:hypothetical protein
MAQRLRGAKPGSWLTSGVPDTELRHQFTVAATPAAVSAHLTEPASYVGLSPLVVEVRDVGREGGTTRYTAVERFRFLGFLRYDSPIVVTLRLKATEAVYGDVVSPGGIRMRYRFGLEPDGDGTRVTDALRMHAPFGLLRFAASRARAVQLARSGILAGRLENSSTED